MDGRNQLAGKRSATGIEVGPNDSVGPQREQRRITQQRKGCQIGIGDITARPTPSGDVIAVIVLGIQKAGISYLGQALDEWTIGQVIDAVERQHPRSRAVSGAPQLRARVFGDDILRGGAARDRRHSAMSPEVEGMLKGQTGVRRVSGIRVRLPKVGVQVPEQAGHVEFPRRNALVAEELTGGGIRIAGLIMGIVEVDRLIGRNYQVGDTVQEAIVARVRSVGIGQHTNPLGITHMPHPVGADGPAGDIPLEDVTVGFEAPVAIEVEVKAVFERIHSSVHAPNASDHRDSRVVIQIGQHPSIFEDLGRVVQVKRTALVQVRNIGQCRVPLVGLRSAQRQPLAGGGEAPSIKRSNEIRGDEQRGRLPHS